MWIDFDQIFYFQKAPKDNIISNKHETNGRSAKKQIYFKEEQQEGCSIYNPF